MSKDCQHRCGRNCSLCTQFLHPFYFPVPRVVARQQDSNCLFSCLKPVCLSPPTGKSLFALFLEQFDDLLVKILLAAAVVSFVSRIPLAGLHFCHVSFLSGHLYFCCSSNLLHAGNSLIRHAIHCKLAGLVPVPSPPPVCKCLHHLQYANRDGERPGRFGHMGDVATWVMSGRQR